MKAKRLRIEIQSIEDQIRETARVIEQVEKGRPLKPQRKLTFESIEVLRQVLTPERLRLLRIIRREKPGSIYELAKLAGRDRSAVTTDLDVLVQLGLVHLDKATGAGRERTIPHVSYSRIEIGVEV